MMAVKGHFHLTGAVQGAENVSLTRATKNIEKEKDHIGFILGCAFQMTQRKMGMLTVFFVDICYMFHEPTLLKCLVTVQAGFPLTI